MLVLHFDYLLLVSYPYKQNLVGLRRSEIVGILKSKINLDECKLIIKNTRVRCGNKTIFKKKNKSQKSTRCLYLPKLIIDILMLDEKRQQKSKLFYGDDYIESNFLCVIDNGQPLKVNYISDKFKKTFDKFIKEETEKYSNFKFPYITLHKLRHLNISSLLANSAYLTDVQANVGHSTVDTTIHYTHNYAQGKKEIANKVDEIYSPLIKIG